jgi:[glutamine synthetase] adenylyltransferase / [glutamine synthetase]-adenylyl-L-tyrosine phosphorylase
VLTPEILGRTFADAPDPELARVAFSRVGATPDARDLLGRPDVLPVASRLLGFSTAAADLLLRHPEEIQELTDVRARDRAELDRELAADVDAYGAPDGLRRFRRRAMLRIAARDLVGAPLDEVVREISDVADACIAAATPPGLAVVALGKLGGRELNYASDVDLLLIHPDGWEPEEAERAGAALISTLSEPTSEGVALRVDLALRPGGRAGPLARSLDATLAYYEREAATWERQAMIKARAAAGDEELARAFVDGVAAFVYPADLRETAIHEVRQTKVRLEEYMRRRGKELIEVKRGRGGIRDVEFAVQLLQIVHGRRDERLREPNTLAALATLADEGYVARDDADALADAYRFLRRLEHRLQIVRDLQTHDLPPDRHARTTLARSLDLRGADELQAEYDRMTALVRGIHERLFYRPLLEAFAGPVQPSPGHDREATEELLAGLGFMTPGRSFESLERLVGADTRIAKVVSNAFPVMAPALALAADPDAALVRLERIAEAVGDRAAPADALAADPLAARRLAHVAGASSFATDLLVADPERIRSLSGTLFGAPAVDSQAQLVEAVTRTAGRELTPREAGEAIAAVAYRVVREAVSAAEPELPFAAIGLGKLGAKELNVASDLDLVFVYDGEGPEDLARATAAAERVMRHVHDDGWEPDADLRPEGRSGPLARSMAGYLEYWERYAEPWEFQSLLRARHVAGDGDLGRRFEMNAADFAYPPEGLTLDRVVEVRRMRERIERERVKPVEAAGFHFKLGKGSLADVQFAVELSLMRFGGEHPEVRSRRTLEAIERLAAERFLEDHVARDLAEAFVFLSDVKNALEMDRRVHAEVVPPAPGEQTALARRLGFEEYPRQAFLERYLHVTRRCRKAMERVFAQALA